MNQQEQQQQPAKPEKVMKELVRIVHTDLEGNSTLYYGLTRIKGISWTLSGAICYLLRLSRQRKVGTLTDIEVKKIEETVKNLHAQNIPYFLLNRPRTEQGKPKHLISTDLELQTKMDIKRLREIQSYKGIRHALGLPVRGQRTKAHFRKGKALGVVKKKQQPAKKPAKSAKKSTGKKK